MQLREKYGAGIGAGYYGDLDGNVNIYGGTVTATGGKYGAGIGGGDDGDQGGTVTITGGTVKATGYYGSGIGGGSEGNGADVNISGGTVEAVSNGYSAAIGGGFKKKNGTVNISGGDVSAKSKLGCGIGCGWGNDNGQGGDINITGGAVDASSHNGYCAGIGAGGGDDSGGDAGNITIKDAAVVAGSSKGAGIGGGGTQGLGSGGTGGKIVIGNSAVFAMSAKRGAGIGGGEKGSGGTVTIHDSYVEATGGYDSYNYLKDKANVMKKFKALTPANALSDFASQYDDKIADLILYYLLSGEWGGSGIGGGANGDGGDITITGTSTVIATGGMNGASAVGHGTGKTGNGTLTMLDSHWVKAGANESMAKRMEATKLESACHDDQFAMILPACEHPSTSYRSVNSEYHEKYCRICGDSLSEKEKHSWNDNAVCNVCGYSAEQTDVIMKLRGQGGSYKKTVKVPTNLEYVLPECPEIPQGREFVGWRVNGGEYSDSYFVPGDTITPTEPAIELAAVYYVIKNEEYINEWGEKNTVSARRINNTAFTHNIFLTTGWYTFNSEVDVPENIVFIIDGNVNLIIPDGYTINFDTASAESSFSGGSLSIFGQSGQTGVLNFTHSDRTIHSLTTLSQYGANINADGRIINCGVFNIRRGSVKALGLEAFHANILGGSSELGQLTAIDLTLGWTELSDSISVGTVNTMSRELTVTEDQALKDASGKTYKNTVSCTEISDKSLTPYLEHSFGEPEWLWEDCTGSVRARFTCTDEGCTKTQTVDAEVTSEAHETYTTYKAVCSFYGKTYTDTKSVNTKWDIIIRECDGGTVTASSSSAEYGEKITLKITPDKGYILTGLSVINDDDENDSEITISENSFIMPAGRAVVSAVFMRHFERKEPYIDAGGAYIAGNIGYFEDAYGRCYYEAEDGTVGEQIEEKKMPGAVSLSYFVFMPYRNGWQITKYNGPLEQGDVLSIPESYDGKPVVCLGRSNPIVNSRNSFSVRLNKNVGVINYNAFSGLNVTAVTGDTSGLKTIMANAFANADGANGSKLDIRLEYPGIVESHWSAFMNTNVTFRMTHSTAVSDTSGARSVQYIFNDAHSYGDQEPQWSFDVTGNVAYAEFICTNVRCAHKETLRTPLIITTDEDGDFYRASVVFEGKTYTVSGYLPSNESSLQPDPESSSPNSSSPTPDPGPSGPDTGDSSGSTLPLLFAAAFLSLLLSIPLRRRRRACAPKSRCSLRCVTALDDSRYSFLLKLVYAACKVSIG